MSKLLRITCVLAYWCPHCDPITIDILKKISDDLNVPLRLLDIDDVEQEKLSDLLVKQYGDWTPDYLIPQTFFEYEDGFKHVFTGSPQGLDFTKQKWQDFLKSDFYRDLLSQSK